MAMAGTRLGAEWEGPSLICVGPQRTASSWLDRILRAHPRLRFPVHVKETFFFDRYFGRGWDWYRSQFGEHDERMLLAEVGSTYFESDKARERIQGAIPEARILITVRNPIARSFSSFGHEYTKGRVRDDFFDAVGALPRIVESGRYGVLAPEWEKAFGREQIFYVVQEDIEDDPQGQVNRIFDFLGIEAIEIPSELQGRYGHGTIPRYRWLASVASRGASILRGSGLHRVVEGGKRLGLKKVYSGGDPKALTMTRSVFDYLLAEHEDDIRFLEDQLGRSFPHWRDPTSYRLVE